MLSPFADLETFPRPLETVHQPAAVSYASRAGAGPMPRAPSPPPEPVEEVEEVEESASKASSSSGAVCAT